MAQIRKHARTSRTAGRARVALGLTAAGVAGTAALFGTASAAQASGVNWDAVAQCESGGNWGTNTGNGFHGGLQFTNSTWRAYGGGKYASTAEKASRGEQIKVAEKVLRGQGIGAWPVCGHKSGSSKHYSGTHTSGSTSHGSRSVTHRSTHRTATHRTATEHAVTTSRATSPKATGGYVVRSGDTLSTIAGRNHVKGGWRALFQLNRGAVSNPDLIFPGQRIAL